jgi:hypothetical protein
MVRAYYAPNINELGRLHHLTLQQILVEIDSLLEAQVTQILNNHSEGSNEAQKIKLNIEQKLDKKLVFRLESIIFQIRAQKCRTFVNRRKTLV